MAMPRRSTGNSTDVRKTSNFSSRRGDCDGSGFTCGKAKILKRASQCGREHTNYCKKNYGRVAMPDIKADPGSDPLNAEVLAIVAAAHADVTGKTEMAPVQQPPDMRISARFMAYLAREGKSYAVAIFLDPKA